MDSDEMSSSTTGALEEGATAAVVSDVSSQDRFADIRERFESGSDLSDADVDAIADVALTYVRQLMTFFGEEHVTIDEYDGDDGELILDVSGDDLAVFIGRHGRTLDALQMLVTSYMSNVMRFHYPIVIDIEGYKARRRQKLVSLATQAEARAIRQRGEVRLAPMNAYERRIVHLTLANSERVSTHSEGVDPQRKVVVTFVR
ncbi:Jag family protein [Olsenella massiliensis]|uniref:Jag family protein n=1 Tax=Olsenella massiliensis TaxID=1622075 RepID=UPI000A569D42|nr:R3H domain-containing nucleic acid-binding protein [Olsenella massiliensis]